MIEFTKAFKASDGQAYFTIEDARQAEIECMMAGDESFEVVKSESQESIAKWIVDNQEKIVDILTTTENSKPKARAINGGRKPRKPKTPATITASETAA
jgi:hypothetical protein